ncbi:MAG: TolC family protein [Rikenellaceae bacterium]
MKNRYLILLLAIGVAQNSFAQKNYTFERFKSEVLNYSEQIKQSEAQREAMAAAVKLSHSAFLPSVDAGGSYQYRINDYEVGLGSTVFAFDHDTYSADIGVVQPIYAGGQIRNSYDASKIESEMADKGVELTTDNIILATESAYWGAAAQKAMYETMCEYVEIISQLEGTIKDKYDDGLVAKTELIQMQSRKQEAQIQCSNSLLAYRIALQNLNSLIGCDPLSDIEISDSIQVKMNVPKYYTIQDVLNRRPDYVISQLGVEYQKSQVKLAGTAYKPTFGIGFNESWGTKLLNLDGSTLFNSTLYASLKIPIFHGGAARHKKSMQSAILTAKESEMKDTEEQITKEIAASWTELSENITQVDIAKENCTLAEENLELNTFSYNEGKLQIVDVLSAQVSWIQAYTNLIQIYHKQRIAYAAYQKSIGSRYIEE